MLCNILKHTVFKIYTETKILLFMLIYLNHKPPSTPTQLGIHLSLFCYVVIFLYLFVCTKNVCTSLLSILLIVCCLCYFTASIILFISFVLFVYFFFIFTLAPPSPLPDKLASSGHRNFHCDLPIKVQTFLWVHIPSRPHQLKGRSGRTRGATGRGRWKGSSLLV